MNMESVLSKLRDRVSSTVYQVTSNISTALPGNALTREYDVISQVATAGPNCVWKVFDAIKKSTKEDAALFVFDKKCLDRYSKKDKEIVLDFLRKGVSQLTRLRHPAILTVQHTIEESRDSLAFATEPVTASLANLLGERENMPYVGNADDNFDLYDVEIKYGLLQISEGLAFLHNDVKMIHRNVSPESIVVNRNGVWKIASFDFCAQTVNPNETPLKFPQLNILNNNDIPPLILPNFDYIAPEYINKNGALVDSSADMFSLGLLTYTLYNKGKLLLPTGGVVNASRIEKLRVLPQSTFNCIPEDSRSHIKMLLSIDTTLRPDAHQFTKLHFFEDILVKTLQYLDALYQWDNLQKSHFYKGLPEVLSRMPTRVKLQRVVSGLAKEFVNSDMVPFVLPNILLIAHDTDDKEFQKWIMPELIAVFKMKEPLQIGIILMQNMEFLVTKFKSQPDAIKEQILPLIYRSLESDAQQIQELCLSIIPSLAHLIDYTAMKNALLPRIKKLVLGTKLLSVRVNCLLCVGKILEHLDKWLILDEVFPILSQVPSKEPAVIMASIGIYKLTMNSNKLGITKEVMATKVVPYLVPLSIESGLTLQQFQTIMSLIRDMLSKIEEEHQVKLEQLNSIKVQQQTLFTNFNASSYDVTTNINSLTNSNSTETVNAFNSVNSVNAASLTLEDKERMAKEKEMNERLKTQAPLVSQPVNRVEPPKPKDLTSTLMTSNLSSLSLNSNNKPAQQPNYNIASYNSTLNSYTTSPINSQFNGSNAFHYQPQTQSIPVQSQLTQPIIRPNLSAFDSIVIPDIKKQANQSSTQPIRTMMSSSTNPMVNNSWQTKPSNSMNNNNNNGNFGFANQNNEFGEFYDANTQMKQSKQLSKSELEDFLN